MLEIISIIISICALVSSVYVGIKQVRISKMQIKFQNKVELYLLTGPITLHNIDNIAPDETRLAIFIRNIGNQVIYLEKYTYDGKDYPLSNEVLPPVAAYDGFRYIFLPRDGTTHISLKITFKDWQKQQWQTIGYADFREGKWEVTYSPCEKIGKG